MLTREMRRSVWMILLGLLVIVLTAAQVPAEFGVRSIVEGVEGGSGDPWWVSALDRFGVSVLLILFGLALVWRAFPRTLTWLDSTITASKVVCDAVPRMERALEKLVEQSEKMPGRLDRIEQAVDEHSRRLAEIAQRDRGSGEAGR